mgnify:CR=1 FL=1
MGRFSLRHLKTKNAVSSLLPLSTTHLPTISLTWSSLSTTLLNFFLTSSTSTSPDALSRPHFLPKHRLWGLILSSKSEKSLFLSLLRVSAEIPLSAWHSSLHFFQLAFCSSVRDWKFLMYHKKN